MSTREHFLRADLHAYLLPVTPKTLRETLCVAQGAVLRAGGDRAQHDGSVLAQLIDECDRQRPLGADGKHGDRHTPECGC